jgi:hypothetical protein
LYFKLRRRKLLVIRLQIECTYRHVAELVKWIIATLKPRFMSADSHIYFQSLGFECTCCREKLKKDLKSSLIWMLYFSELWYLYMVIEHKPVHFHCHWRSKQQITKLFSLFLYIICFILPNIAEILLHGR